MLQMFSSSEAVGEMLVERLAVSGVDTVLRISRRCSERDVPVPVASPAIQMNSFEINFQAGLRKVFRESR